MSGCLLLFLALAFAVLLGCLIPSAWLPPLPNDKLMHFLAFGVLCLLAGQMAHGGLELLLCMIGLLLAGLAIECLQNLVPGRKFCWRDMGANTAGILTGGVVLVFFM